MHHNYKVKIEKYRKMKIERLVLIALLFLSVSLSAKNTDGWLELFNGKNLKNWELLNGEAEFKVEGDMIVATSKLNTPNTFLATKKKFDDFVLEYEAKIDNGLNAGVQIRSNSFSDYKDGRVHGYQVELDPSKRAWSGGIYDEARRGWLYHLQNNPEAREAFKKEAWNHFRVEAIGNDIRVWVNGVQAVDLVDDVTASGFIALQVHNIHNPEKVGKQVRYKNIKIKTENLLDEITLTSSDIPQISCLDNQLTDREKSEGWQMLWDGKTTNGWRGAKLDKFPENGWQIKEGELVVEENGGHESTIGGDIVTIKKYRNFELQVDFKFDKGANSGIKYFVDTELNMGKGSSIGCEYQILDDELHLDAKKGVNGNRTLASLYDLIKADALLYAPNQGSEKRVNKYGWNRARIVVQGNKVQHYLNGILVVEYERANQMWKALVAYSKYRVWPNFGEAETGHILLQDHGNKVVFKNIKIKEL